MGSVESSGALTTSAGVNGSAYQGQEPGEGRRCGHGSELDSGWPALGSSCMSLVECSPSTGCWAHLCRFRHRVEALGS